MRYTPEYILYRKVSYYLKAQYPKVLFHFDPTGLNLSKAQAGMMKAIQGGKGFPDLQILERRGQYGGLFLELKPEGTKLYKKDGTAATPHIQDQEHCLVRLSDAGYYATFAVGFDQAKLLIDLYLNDKL